MRITPLLILVWALIACETSDTGDRYLDVTLGQPLEMPPDLAKFEVESNFDLPEGFSGDDKTVRNKVPVLAMVDSLQLQGSGDFYWLSVEEPVQNLYQLVKNFWALEGYVLIVDEPVIGIMETEWVYANEGGSKDGQAWWEKILGTGDYSASQDQFKTRIERDPTGGAGNRIYIAHRGTEIDQEVRIGDQDSDDYGTDEWHFRRDEPELEIEMLSRLMVFLGLHQDAVDIQIAQSGLFKPRAWLETNIDEGSPYLMLKDPYQIAWNRIYQQLERMNFEIDFAEFKGELSGKGSLAVLSDTVETVESTGFFSFGASDKHKPRRFKLSFSEETNDFTRVELIDEDGNLDTSPEGAAFLAMLFEEIK